ncbi:MAG: hypothetical protein ACKKMW_02775 [Candidatus Nealsonbacteria bacterium]
MYVVPLNRKISKIEINEKEMARLMPENIAKVFGILAQTKNILIKGGLARAVLSQILKNEEKIEKNRALDNAWEKPSDIDLILSFIGTKRKNLPLLNRKIIGLIEKLKKTGFELNNRDIELIKGSFKNEKIIRKILETRDITINEVALVPEERSWLLYYTDKAHRDLINSVAMLTINNPSTIRYDYGRLVASPYGIIRLTRFLIEDKVKNIYLPNWWIERNNQEAKKTGRPKLGSYGLLLAERYVNASKLQSKLIKILNLFKLTDSKDFNQYKKEQKQSFKKYSGQEFQLRPETSFEELQKALTKKSERHTDRRRERKELRTVCSHFIESFICTRCHKECKIKYCIKCNKIEIIPKKEKKAAHLYYLFCNETFIKADRYWDKQGFYPQFPDKAE